ncbi:MAG TPA: hypothetical protein VGF87_05490 [Acidimicrobiales bacterium]|jgi:hypothetical protein
MSQPPDYADYVDAPEEVRGAPGRILVRRRRPVFAGLVAAVDVYIDDVKVGRAPRGQTVTFEVSSRSHPVYVVVSKSKRSVSNTMVVDVQPGRDISLVCGATLYAYQFIPMLSLCLGLLRREPGNSLKLEYEVGQEG